LKRLLKGAAIAARALAAFAMLAAAAAAAPAAEPAAPRVEARSGDLLAVGVVHGDKMNIHVSRLVDNAPVRDAAITVILRSAAHVATAEADGSYTVQTQDLGLPGAAAVEIEVSQGAARESLKGTLEIGPTGGAEEKNNARQLWWWVLNFGVCFGVLWLVSRRRKAARD
jgi:hypothetical protein